MSNLTFKTPTLKRLALVTVSCSAVALGVILLQQRRHVRAISPGSRLEGILQEFGRIRRDPPRGPEAQWVLDGSAGQEVTLAAESYEFDVYMLLLDSLGRQIAWADNNGGFFNARIVTRLPSTGRYTVVVCGANAEQFGTYWLSLDDGEHEFDWSRAAAESYYQGASEWAERLASPRAASWISLGMGQYCAQRKEWDRAEEYYSQSLAHARKDDFTYCQWAVAIERGRLFARRRRYEQAVDEFQRALELSHILRSSHEAETIVLIEFANLYYSTARTDLAKIYFRTATTRAEQYAPHSTLAALYTRLSESLRLEDKEKAIFYAEKANSLRVGLEPRLELKAIHALAGMYLFVQPERSAEGLALASEMRDRAHLAGCIDDEIAALTLMSMAKYARNDIDAMIGLARAALELTSPEDEDPNARRIALQLQADGEMVRGNYRAALDSCLKALETVEGAWASEQIEELRRELLSQSRAICTQIIRNLYALNSTHPDMEYARQAFDYAERSRSRSLLEQLFTGEAAADAIVDPNVFRRDQELLERLSAVRGQLVLLRISSNPSRETLYRLQEEQARLMAERIRLRSEIRDSTANIYRAAHLSPLDAEQAQKRLAKHHPSSAVLYYQLGIQESFLIVLTRERCEFFRLSDWTTISKAVSEFRAQISSQQAPSQPASHNSYAYNDVAHQLYQMLIEPAANLILGRDLIIVPSDALCDLAFESLVVVNPNRGEVTVPIYLIERHAVSYTPSVSVLSEIESRSRQAPSGDHILLLGDASAGAVEPGRTLRGDDATDAAMRRLPAAREEVLQIARLAKEHGLKTAIWLGSEAKEEKFTRADLTGFRFIHIATHGISDHQEGESSALTLAPDPKGEEDGILTSDEAAKLKLNCELIALSGCETSIGHKAGAEGVVGFNRTFLVAGARCVFGSLWQVDDSWTEKLMTSFYENLFAKRVNKTQALRSAKLKLIRLGATPSQWAAFVLAGSYR